jgi:hypothetical protein
MESGDYLVTEFDGADIVLNKNSKIIKRNIAGFQWSVIIILIKLLDPITKSVFELIGRESRLFLIYRRIKTYQLKDTLELIEFPFGNRMARTGFTILAVADTTFHRYGINNIDEMISYFTDAP